MKKLILSTLVCFAVVIGKAQPITINGENSGSCDMNITFYAIDPVTCTTLATSSGSFNVVSGNPASNFTITWVPGTPSVSFILAASVNYTGCPGPGVLVGLGPSCGFNPTMTIPPTCGCGPDMVDFPTYMLGPVYPPILVFNLNAHP